MPSVAEGRVEQGSSQENEGNEADEGELGRNGRGSENGHDEAGEGEPETGSIDAAPPHVGDGVVEGLHLQVQREEEAHVQRQHHRHLQMHIVIKQSSQLHRHGGNDA
eukprot:2489638-Rhodomonas_salina.1